MELILGLDDFGEVVASKLELVDKSLFIKEILDRRAIHVTLITRPRRFGKTLNLSMLQHFLAAEVNGLKTAGMFDNLKIAQAGANYMGEQGKHPVIFVSYKSIKFATYDQARAGLQKLMSSLYAQHYTIFESKVLYTHERAIFERILNQEATDEDLMSALADLSGYLHRHHGHKPWLLIDEYDTPIQSAYMNGYYEPMLAMMRGIFGNALKGNPNLHRAVVTGILRIAKENLFSGLNNLDVYSVLNTEYSEHFGFMESEVDAVLKAANLSVQAKEIKAWYNGYRMGNVQVYNPWSIAKCVNSGGIMQPYWVNTSDNGLIKQVMAQASGIVKQQFQALLQGEIIEAPIDETMVFSDLSRSGVLWSLFLYAGYLTPVEIRMYDGETLAGLRTPNQEVDSLYRMIIRQWFDFSPWQQQRGILLDSLVNGELTNFLKELQKFLLESMRYFDVKGTEPERFYHGFVMGLIVGLAETHEVHSNKESGYGRYDVMIIPKDKRQLGLVIEFKIADSAEELATTAQQALEQIASRGYVTQLQQQGVNKVLTLGLGFYGKQVALATA